MVLDAFPRRLDDYFLAQEGIIVLAVDHRGSGHFGKRGMDLMHRCLGKWEIADYSSAVAWLRTLPFVDGGRIGITGGSYGGYVAALAVVSAPDVFSCGIAEYSVTDWSLYDSVYTERFMDLPAENPEGYRQASVLTHAGDLPRRPAPHPRQHGRQRPHAEHPAAAQLPAGPGEDGRAHDLPGRAPRGARAQGGRGRRLLPRILEKNVLRQEEVGPVGPVGQVRQEKKE